jgi:hypothetical protein
MTLLDGADIVPGHPNPFPRATKYYSTNGLSAGGSVEIPTITFTAPTSLSREEIELVFDVDIDNDIDEVLETNNQSSLTITVKPLRPNLYFTEHNITDYYAGHDVIITARVMNGTEQPVPAAKVNLKFAGQELQETIAVQGKGQFANQPGGYNYDGNLVVFRVSLPQVATATCFDVEMDIVPIEHESDIDDNALGYKDASGNFQRFRSIVSPLVKSIIPDPEDAMLEMDHLNRNKQLPDLGVLDPGSVLHQWYETRLVNGQYTPKLFTVTLDAEALIMPDQRVAIAGSPKQMESGFGITIDVDTLMLTDYDQAHKLVKPQQVWAMYPELEYGQDTSDWYLFADALEITRDSSVENPATGWQLPVSPYTFYGPGDDEAKAQKHIRLHYTPVWTPDGEYHVHVHTFYAWSPMGQLFDHLSDHVLIEDSMYSRFPVMNR